PQPPWPNWRADLMRSCHSGAVLGRETGGEPYLFSWGRLTPPRLTDEVRSHTLRPLVHRPATHVAGGIGYVQRFGALCRPERASNTDRRRDVNECRPALEPALNTCADH